MRKYLIYILLLSVFTATVSAKNIIIAIEDYPPFQYSENNEVKGINVDIVKEALKRMGDSMEIRHMPHQRILFYLKYGEVDATLGAGYKKSRTKYAYYPKEEIYAETWLPFKIKGTKISLNKDLSNINKLTIGVIGGYQYGGKIQNAIDKKLFKNITKLQNEEALLKGLLKKKFDMYIGSKTNTSLLAKKLKYSDKIEEVKTTNSNKKHILNIDKTYIIFSKKTTSKKFVRKFSDTITKMKKDGSVGKIIKRYL